LPPHSIGYSNIYDVYFAVVFFVGCWLVVSGSSKVVREKFVKIKKIYFSNLLKEIILPSPFGFSKVVL